jgi:hypothetical protein
MTRIGRSGDGLMPVFVLLNRPLLHMRSRQGFRTSRQGKEAKEPFEKLAT